MVEEAILASTTASARRVRAGRSSAPVRCCLIGTGQMGLRHARSLIRSADVKLVATADPSSAARAAAVRLTGVPAFLDYRVMLALERPEFVVIASPTSSHAEVGLDVLRRGVHALIEKPLASTAEQA